MNTKIMLSVAVLAVLIIGGGVWTWQTQTAPASSEDTMVKHDDAMMPKTDDAMMHDDTMMASSSDSMMEGDKGMMDDGVMHK